MIKVAINGFGRIGRSAFKIAVEKYTDQVEIVAINDLASPATLAHLLKYDSAYGIWNHEVTSTETHLPGEGVRWNKALPCRQAGHLGGGSLIVDGKSYTVLAEKEPASLPWKDLGVDVVIESTGKFTDKEGASLHLQAGAKKVVISAPAKGEGIPTLVLGVNAESYQGEEVVNNASCTTNCISPVVKVLNDQFGVLKATMTTIHAYTHDQNLQDGPHKDLRRARAAYVNIIPTTTGAAIATTEAIPDLKGRFDGRALRVPVICGSISDITFVLKKKTSVEEVNNAIKKACEDSKWRGIVAWSEEPLVSTDIIGRSESAIVDLGLTQVVDGDLVKVFAWYDNEWGYSNRLIEQVINIGTT